MVDFVFVERSAAHHAPPPLGALRPDEQVMKPDGHVVERQRELHIGGGWPGSEREIGGRAKTGVSIHEILNPTQVGAAAHRVFIKGVVSRHAPLVAGVAGADKQPVKPRRNTRHRHIDRNIGNHRATRKWHQRCRAKAGVGIDKELNAVQGRLCVGRADAEDGGKDEK
ncbi:MAG: hypothetical protein LH609_05970 [Rudanella sp.]|nr:hypothetical protein [Rudanella sp.]